MFGGGDGKNPEFLPRRVYLTDRSRASIKTTDVKFSGSLTAGIHFDLEEFRKALVEIRQTYFRHRALFRGLNGAGFGERLRKLIDARSGDYQGFADDIGVSLPYVQALMDEHSSVSNPSIRLLKKMAAILGESVSYLIGESEEADPIWIESKPSWHAWATTTPGLDAGVAIRIKDDWCDQYRSQKVQPGVAQSRANHSKQDRYFSETQSGTSFPFTTCK